MVHVQCTRKEQDIIIIIIIIIIMNGLYKQRPKMQAKASLWKYC